MRIWVEIVKRAKWKNWGDLKKDFPKADKVGERVIFDIKGNDYRLIVIVKFWNERVYYRWLGTHAEYSKLTKEQIEKL